MQSVYEGVRGMFPLDGWIYEIARSIFSVNCDGFAFIPIMVLGKAKFPGGKFGALDPGLNFAEGKVASGGGVIGEGSEAAVIGGSELCCGEEGCRFKDAVTDLKWGFNLRIDRVDDADEDGVIRLKELAYQLKDSFSVGFAGHLEVEASGVQLEEIRQQLGIIHVGAVGGVVIASGADVNSD
jgi:hypothetical protein